MSGKRGLVWFGNEKMRKCVSINVSSVHNLLIYFYSQYRYSANVQGSGGHRNLQKRRRFGRLTKKLKHCFQCQYACILALRYRGMRYFSVVFYHPRTYILYPGFHDFHNFKFLLENVQRYLTFCFTDSMCRKYCNIEILRFPIFQIGLLWLF